MIQSLDDTIMLNAHEEARLAELLADYGQSRPDVSIEDARATVSARLIHLIRIGRVGFYEMSLTSTDAAPLPHRELTPEEAVAVVANSASWNWETIGEKAFFCMFARDDAVSGSNSPPAN